MKTYNRFLFLNTFVLKIIALIAMTLDHTAILLSLYIGSGDPLIQAFRIVGRIAMPLFCFCITEGVINTKDIRKYILRLGIMGLFISIVLGLIPCFNLASPSFVATFGNIYIDLILGALSVYLLSRKDIRLKLLAIIPLGISICSFFCNSYEAMNSATIWWYPYMLRTQYGFYGVLLCIGFYFARCITGLMINKISVDLGSSKEIMIEQGMDRLANNVGSVIFLVIITFLYWIASTQFGTQYLAEQQFAILAGALFLFYNGKRGYNALWIKYGFYLYYPIHIGILAIIYFLINL